MLGITTIRREIGGRVLTIETGRLAKQAHGAAVIQYGDTVVLVAAVSAAPRNEEVDFFPLSVDYREKTSAAGKFPGGFFKREGRPTTKEVLTARKIDRPIRPLFPEGYIDEVQIMANVLSADQENDPDVLAMIGASAALCVSKIPFLGPIGICRVGRVNGQFVVNPTHQQLVESDLNLVMSGTKKAVNMIELGAKQLGEQVIAEAVKVGHQTIVTICEMIEELVRKVGTVEKEMPQAEHNEQLYQQLKARIADRLRELKQIREKQKRNEAVEELFGQALAEYAAAPAGGSGPGVETTDVESTQSGTTVSPVMLKKMLYKIERQIVRELILSGKRLDGRGLDDIRPITCEVGILPRTHGSALFARGETQALVTATLGTIRDAQLVDGLLEEYDQKFMVHYNFPPFSVGEVRPIRGPGRREIGHGALAECALERVRPNAEQFSYTIRLVSDILESNGSSSMATVCAGSLAMMDAGIPIQEAVAGISIGLVQEQDRYVLLTDIIGEEDHLGDMDFKVAGTANGITAMQFDIKTEGLAHHVMVEALERARQARLKILEIMGQTISEARPEISKYAPRLVTLEINPELIGKVIGPGGKVVKSIQDETGTNIEIEEDGTIYISCFGGDGHLKAKERIEALIEPPKVDRVYRNAKVVSIKDFGVFVEIAPGVEGLCHISELNDSFVRNAEDICRVGDVIPVKLIAIDDQGRLKLSRRAVLAQDSQSQPEQQNGAKGHDASFRPNRK
jgi:polyribonucleotide nucleotidyltransferase